MGIGFSHLVAHADCCRPNGPYAPDELAKFTSDWNAIAARPRYLTLTVVDNATKRLIGMVTILNNVPEHLKAELGYVWYVTSIPPGCVPNHAHTLPDVANPRRFTPAVHRTYANTESAYLIMEHLFKLGYRCVAACTYTGAVRGARARPCSLARLRQARGVEVRRPQQEVDGGSHAAGVPLRGHPAAPLHCQGA